MAKDDNKKAAETAPKETKSPEAKAPKEENTGTGEANTGTGETKSKKVSVEESLLVKIKEQMDKQDAIISKQNKEIERLKFAADKGRLYRFDSMREEDIIRTARVAVWKDETGKEQIIQGWAMQDNEVFYDPQGKMHVKQNIKLLLGSGEDRSEVTVDYLYWSQNVTSISGDIIGETVDKAQGIHLRKIRFDDGKEVEMDIRFINM